MKSIAFLIAGAVFVSTALASDPYAEERFKAKFGRYTQAEEVRREAAKKEHNLDKHREPQVTETAMCEMPNCCKPDRKAHAMASMHEEPAQK